MTSAELVELLKILREHRVAKFIGSDVSIDFAEDAFAPTWPTAQNGTQPPATADENCTCGHPLHDHTQVGCVHGCEIETCGRQEQ